MTKDSAVYDYIVVGGGSAGCVVAARLTEQPEVRVLLLEAGPGARCLRSTVPLAYSKLFRTRRDWGLHTEPQPELLGRRLAWPRGRMLGGSSAINDMVYVRGNRADYDGWAAAGNDGWSYTDVLPYFRRSEDQERGGSPHHGVGGPLRVSDLRYVHPTTKAFLAAAAATGLPANADFNGPVQDGVGYYQVTQRDGRRETAATAFLQPARDRGNLTIVTGATTTRVLTTAGRAVGVEWQAGGRTHRASADSEVLLAAGSVGSPHLLLLSGIGPAAQLRAAGIAPVVDLPGVGANLQDHLIVPTSWLAASPTSLLDANKPAAAATFLARRTGPLSSNVGEAGGFVRITPDAPAPDVQLVFAPLFLGDVDDSGRVDPREHGFTIGALLLQPRSTGSIMLRSADPTAAPVIDPGYLTEPGDLDLLAAGVALAGAIGEQPVLARHAARRYAPTDSSPAALRRHIRETAKTLFHPVGTCRMGHDPLAVVDSELRVHGIDGLRVVDAAVMPSVTRGNTNAPTIMIAERAADLIRSNRRLVTSARTSS